MHRQKGILVLAGAALVWAGVWSANSRAQSDTNDGPRYTNGNDLIRPSDYREWMFLSSGLGMTYESERGAGAASTARPQRFQNVFVNPSSYRHFKDTGEWPDGSIFVLEIRRSATEASINRAGRFQSELTALEAEVKDSRFEDGWAFYNFGGADSMPDAVAPLAGNEVAECIECHTEHTAVERTFVQFYPTALEIAREHGTLKPGFE